MLELGAPSEPSILRLEGACLAAMFAGTISCVELRVFFQGCYGGESEL
jgi:hypothetical protein